MDGMNGVLLSEGAAAIKSDLDTIRNGGRARGWRPVDVRHALEVIRYLNFSAIEIAYLGREGEGVARMLEITD